MKAIVYTKYGPPEVARLMEVPKPTPNNNEVLVKVYASTVNRTDAGYRTSEYFILRFWSGLCRPKCQILGCEFAGVSEETGNSVKELKTRDKVFGYNDKTFGGHGEYLTIAETNALTTMPENVSFDKAAALTEGAHYALVDNRAAEIDRVQNVLVYGASGFIGSAAVQLLKHFSASVESLASENSSRLNAMQRAEKNIQELLDDLNHTFHRLRQNSIDEELFDVVACFEALKKGSKQ